MSVEDYKKTKPNVSKYLLLLLLMIYDNDGDDDI